MSTKEQFVQIARGGNKFELFAQLFQWDRKPKYRNTFSLTLQNTSTAETVHIETIITGIREIGSDTSFKIQGIIAEELPGWNVQFWMVQYPWLERFKKFEASYHTRTRKGTIRPSKA